MKKSKQGSLSRKSNASAGKSVLSRSTSVLRKGEKTTKLSQGDPKASPACGPTPKGTRLRTRNNKIGKEYVYAKFEQIGNKIAQKKEQESTQKIGKKVKSCFTREKGMAMVTEK